MPIMDLVAVEEQAVRDGMAAVATNGNGKQRPDPAARLKADTADLNRARNDIDKERRKIAEAEDRIAYLLEDVRVLELYVKAHEKAVGYQTKGTE